MKRIAILVIAAVNQPVYIHYIRNYWKTFIEYTNASKPNIDVYLLVESGTSMEEFSGLEQNTIVDATTRYDLRCDKKYHRLGVPGILSKTIHAFEELHESYDVFFRTNLSSLIKATAFEDFVNQRDFIGYSGAFVWHDSLRDNLVHFNRIGPGKSIKKLAELDRYEGNSFASGSGYFLNQKEAASLVRRQSEIRYDIIDDVSVGLMFERCEGLNHFSHIVRPNKSAEDIGREIDTSTACHVRLQHFPLQLAQSVWHELKKSEPWL